MAIIKEPRQDKLTKLSLFELYCGEKLKAKATKMRTKYPRLCACFQAITKKKNKKRQPKMLVCRLLSE